MRHGRLYAGLSALALTGVAALALSGKPGEKPVNPVTTPDYVTLTSISLICADKPVRLDRNMPIEVATAGVVEKGDTRLAVSVALLLGSQSPQTSEISYSGSSSDLGVVRENVIIDPNRLSNTEFEYPLYDKDPGDKILADMQKLATVKVNTSTNTAICEQ
jgi:hypothetical protein